MRNGEENCGSFYMFNYLPIKHRSTNTSAAKDEVVAKRYYGRTKFIEVDNRRRGRVITEDAGQQNSD